MCIFGTDCCSSLLFCGRTLDFVSLEVCVRASGAAWAPGLKTFGRPDACPSPDRPSFEAGRVSQRTASFRRFAVSSPEGPAGGGKKRPSELGGGPKTKRPVILSFSLDKGEASLCPDWKLAVLSFACRLRAI